MASFDFVDAAAKGYEFVWRHRNYLVCIAFPVVFVKVACYLAIFLMAVQENVLRKELFLMPAYFIEAVFLSGLVRFALYREPIAMIGSMALPCKPQNPPFAQYDKNFSYSQCIQAGIIYYLLFRVFWAVWLWLNSLLQVEQDPEAIQQFPPTFLNILAVIVIMACVVWVLLWFVRWAWVFVAVAQGHSLKAYMKVVYEIKIPIYMTAGMLLCFVPLDVLFENLKLGALSVFQEQMALKILSVSVLEAIDETLIMAICTVAMSYAVHHLMDKKKREK